MLKNSFKQKVEEILAPADVRINGDRLWDIQVHNENFYKRVLAEGSLGFGESYMDGWWDSTDIAALVEKIFHSGLFQKVKTFQTFKVILKAKLSNLQRKSKAFEIGQKHYDIGNDLYRLMLDKRLVYSCAYWKNASDLDQAQEHKLDLVCQKLSLRPGMTVLDIGCGWGGLAKFAAEKYKVSLVGLTVSKNQLELASAVCQGLPVEIRLQDYREIDQKFDRIVSIGMFEHVGYKNYRTFMEVVNRCLEDNGLFLLHTIGGNQSAATSDPWILKYIFPNSMLPSLKQIATACESLFVMEDWHNFGPDYARTLAAWFNNFDKNWDTLKTDYDQRFYRMWKFYLLSCVGTFRSRTNQLWQIVFSKKGLKDGYQSLR